LQNWAQSMIPTPSPRVVDFQRQRSKPSGPRPLSPLSLIGHIQRADETIFEPMSPRPSSPSTATVQQILLSETTDPFASSPPSRPSSPKALTASSNFVFVHPTRVPQRGHVSQFSSIPSPSILSHSEDTVARPERPYIAQDSDCVTLARPVTIQRPQTQIANDFDSRLRNISQIPVLRPDHTKPQASSGLERKVPVQNIVYAPIRPTSQTLVSPSRPLLDTTAPSRPTSSSHAEFNQNSERPQASQPATELTSVRTHPASPAFKQSSHERSKTRTRKPTFEPTDVSLPTKTSDQRPRSPEFKATIRKDSIMISRPTSPTGLSVFNIAPRRLPEPWFHDDKHSVTIDTLVARNPSLVKLSTSRRSQLQKKECPHNSLTVRYSVKEWDAVQQMIESLPLIIEEVLKDLPEARFRSINIWGVQIGPHDENDPRVGVIMHKFLSATQFNIKEAKARLTATIRWRETFRAAETINQYFPRRSPQNPSRTYEHTKDGKLCVYGPSDDFELQDEWDDFDSYLRRRVSFMEKTIRELDFETLDTIVHLEQGRRKLHPNVAKANRIIEQHYPALQERWTVNIRPAEASRTSRMQQGSSAQRERW